jgi:hypothetical protein
VCLGLPNQFDVTIGVWDFVQEKLRELDLVQPPIAILALLLLYSFQLLVFCLEFKVFLLELLPIFCTFLPCLLDIGLELLYRIFPGLNLTLKARNDGSQLLPLSIRSNGVDGCCCKAWLVVSGAISRVRDHLLASSEIGTSSSDLTPRVEPTKVTKPALINKKMYRLKSQRTG